MTDDLKDPRPARRKVDQSPQLAMAMLGLLLFFAGSLVGIVAVFQEVGRNMPCPGTGFIAAGCVIAGALVISRKPN